MRIGVPREVKNSEHRVGMTPVGVHELVQRGHELIVEHDAGLGSSFTDDDYRKAGATVVDDAPEVWGSAELVLKVKEPTPDEFGLLREDLTLFTYLHLAADEPLVDALLDAGTTAIAYETVQLDSGQLPLLHPMSEVAGCLATQAGASHLLKHRGGRGILLGGIGGVANSEVLVLGAGVAGQSATNIAVGLGANVTLLDTDLGKLRAALARWGNRVTTLASSEIAIRDQLAGADLVIGTVLIPGARAPKLVSDEMIAGMKSGSVLVDVAIDQGGCFEPSRPTTHEDPTFRVHDSLLYCVTNMPAAVPHTSTWALTNATLPYVNALAEHGWRGAMEADATLRRGLSTHAGTLTSVPVAESFDRESVPAEEVLGIEC
jgi:alanine dehydrogenase